MNSIQMLAAITLLIPQILALHNPGVGANQNSYLDCTAKCSNATETKDMWSSTGSAPVGIRAMCFAGCGCDGEDPMEVTLLDPDPNTGGYDDCGFLCDEFLNVYNTEIWATPTSTFTSKWNSMFQFTNPVMDTDTAEGTWGWFPVYFTRPFYSSSGGASDALMDATFNPLKLTKDTCRSACNDRGICTPSYAFETLSAGLVVDQSTGTWSCSAGSTGDTGITTTFFYPFVSGSCTDVDCPADSYGNNVASGCTCTYDGEVTATTESPYYTSTCIGESDYTNAAVYSTPSALFNGIMAFFSCMMAHHY